MGSIPGRNHGSGPIASAPRQQAICPGLRLRGRLRSHACQDVRLSLALANLYLAGLGAELLSQDAPDIVGLSQDTTCYISPLYFHEEDRFADFIVHEAAHVFHNCKRSTLGLHETRSKVWLLDIEYRKRETFAYSCEAYSRINELGTSSAARQALADEFSRAVRISDERADADEVARIVKAAAAARNGWKVILAQCAPARRRPAVLRKGDRDEKIA
jgi:hypothetical protein